MRAGAGFDTINVAYCGKNGVYVVNCQGKNARAVAGGFTCFYVSRSLLLCSASTDSLEDFSLLFPTLLGNFLLMRLR